jgi:hypothetical protein
MEEGRAIRDDVARCLGELVAGLALGTLAKLLPALAVLG